MKKLLTLLLAGIFVLTGCSGGGSAQIPVSPTEQVSISVTNYLSFISRNDYSNYYDKDAKSAWIDYMSLRNNTDFTIYNDRTAQSGSLVQNDRREGLVLLNSTLKITELAREGKILPLDDYLTGNPSWMALPEDFRNTFKINGETYAIPYMANNVVDSGLTLNSELAINTQWLAQLGLSMPQTLEDFENVGLQFLQHDMNGDGIVGNDYLMGFLNPITNTHLMQAFGLYFGRSTSTTFGYDPEMGSIVDALFKDNAEPALTYLHRLYIEGLIDPDSAAYYNYEQISEDIIAAKYGTLNMTNTATLMQAGLNYAAENYERITGKTYSPTDPEMLQWAANVFEPLPPLSTQHPLTYSNTLYGYVMTAQTPSPNQVINRFVDLCYGLNSTTYLECNFGAEGTYSLQSDGTCTVPGYDVLNGICFGNPELAAYPNLGGYYQNSLGATFAATSGQSSAVNYAAALSALNDKIAVYIDRYKARNLMVEVPNYYIPSGKAYSDSARLLRRDVYGDFYRAVLTGSSTIGEALQLYREDAVFFGMADVLSESNAALGLPNAQTLQ